MQETTEQDLHVDSTCHQTTAPSNLPIGLNFGTLMGNRRKILTLEILLFGSILSSYVVLIAWQTEYLSTRQTPEPNKFFNSSSIVIDFEQGQTQEAWIQIAKYDISLIFFYAPWDLDSQKFKKHYESLSKKYRSQVNFIAVNCWHPRGQCASFGEKAFPRYPRIHAVIKDVMVEYIGPLSIKYLNAFIHNILHPLEYLHERSDFIDFRLKHDIIVLKKFKIDPSKYYPDNFKDFWKASLQALYRDPFRRAKFVVVTGDELRDHRIRNTSWDLGSIIYTWDTSTNLNSNEVDVITKITMVNLLSKTLVPWFSPDGTKGNQLSRVLTKDPIFILFTRRGFDLNTNIDHIALKLVAMYYRTCESSSVEELLKSVSDKALKKLPTMKGDDFNINDLHCGSRLRKSNLTHISQNKTLQFVAMDTYLCSSFISQLGLNALSKNTSQALIYNHLDESIFLNPYDNTIAGYSKFVDDWTLDKLNKFYKNSAIKPRNDKPIEDSTFSVQELNSANFEKTVLDENFDTVVYHYAPWCIMCSTINHVFLETAMEFQEYVNIKFVRINNHANDLPEQFNVDGYPTIVIYPSKQKDKIRKFESSVVNHDTLSKFIAENTGNKVSINY